MLERRPRADAVGPRPSSGGGQRAASGRRNGITARAKASGCSACGRCAAASIGTSAACGTSSRTLAVRERERPVGAPPHEQHGLPALPEAPVALGVVVHRHVEHRRADRSEVVVAPSARRRGGSARRAGRPRGPRARGGRRRRGARRSARARARASASIVRCSRSHANGRIASASTTVAPIPGAQRRRRVTGRGWPIRARAREHGGPARRDGLPRTTS